VTVNSLQNQFGYFGKLPTFGDFIHQLLPQDFANGFHTWLQQAMAAARAALGDDFLPAYLSCPAWKFVLSTGVCGEQAIAGLTIPSVDRVGRYFNFTLATVLTTETNPLSYAVGNPEGLLELENTALDILESDYSREDLELQVRRAGQHFNVIPPARTQVESGAMYLSVLLDQTHPFAGQSAVLMDHVFSRDMGAYSVWWSGRQGQDFSRMILCSGMPDSDAYLRMLVQGEGVEPAPAEENYIDRIIADDSNDRGIE